MPVVGPDARPIAVAGARLLAGSVPAGARVRLPEAERQHVLVASGTVRLPGRSGVEAIGGDALRITGGCEPLTALRPCRLLIWSF